MAKPLIGITVDNKNNAAASGTYQCAAAYSKAVVAAGGTPILLVQEIELVNAYRDLCDGLVLTGGVDPRTEPFGQPTHPSARPMDPQRQAFELALLTAADDRPQLGVLGVCLGMQLMALHAGGRLHQYLPDVLDRPQAHEGGARHEVLFEQVDSETSQVECQGSDVVGDRPPVAGRQAEGGCENRELTVVSHHRQAVADPGKLRVVARATDGVIEAVDEPFRVRGRTFYVGVQWHPERAGRDDAYEINHGIFDRLVAASAKTT